MIEALIRELRALLLDRFTGTITLHIRQGEVRRFEKLETVKLERDDGRVELLEVEANSP